MFGLLDGICHPSTFLTFITPFDFANQNWGGTCTDPTAEASRPGCCMPELSLRVSKVWGGALEPKPKIALIGAPLLLYNPPLLDILPVYIIFMLLTPVFLWAADERGWIPVLSLSASVWFLAQWNLRGWIHSALAHWGFPIPLNEMGAFDIFGWQVLWILGLAVG